MAGSSDREAVALQQRLADAKRALPDSMESWLAAEVAHPHWRAMANRFPNMLRALDTQTRVGVENGQALANGYLPTSACSNLVYASWMAFLPSATANTATGSGSQTVASKPLTPAEILERKISMSIDQTGIENVLQQIGEQANDKLPAGTTPLRFELDGAGFQRSGITRNQQIKDFKVDGQSVRQALTLLARRGNPVQPLNDLKSADQKLVWVLVEGQGATPLISLTSRDAAQSASQSLPSEFVP